MEFVFGWKDIARFLGKSERTVRRWHYRYKMPVRRTWADRPFIVCEEIFRWLVISDKLRLESTDVMRKNEARSYHAARMREIKRLKGDNNAGI